VLLGEITSVRHRPASVVVYVDLWSRIGRGGSRRTPRCGRRDGALKYRFFAVDATFRPEVVVLRHRDLGVAELIGGRAGATGLLASIGQANSSRSRIFRGSL
jgi:hypothetical protein